MILYHKLQWMPELSVCVERENVGMPKRWAFYIDAQSFKVIGIPISPVQNEPVKMLYFFVYILWNVSKSELV